MRIRFFDHIAYPKLDTPVYHGQCDFVKVAHSFADLITKKMQPL